jgi:putative transposase
VDQPEQAGQLNVSEATFYRWEKQFVEIGVAEVRELRMLRDENRKLKQLVADLTLDKQILREALGKKVSGRPEARGQAEATSSASGAVCRALEVWRSSVRYVGVRPPQTALRKRDHG